MKKRLRISRLSKLLFLCSGILLLGKMAEPSFAAQAPAANQVPRPDPAAVARGKGDFSASCSFCHGAQAMGTGQAPNLLRSPLLIHDKNGDVLVPFIKSGRPTLGMPSFVSLPPQQLSDIVAFLHAQLLANRSSRLPETALLVGNAKAGGSLFQWRWKMQYLSLPYRRPGGHWSQRSTTRADNGVFNPTRETAQSDGSFAFQRNHFRNAGIFGRVHGVDD